MLKDWLEVADLDRFRAAVPRQIVAGALTGIERYALPNFVREDYLTCYDGDRFVESMRYLRTYPTDLPILRDLLPQIHTPVQIIAGSRDRAVPPANDEFFYERLPDSKLDILDVGHFAWEDAADQLVERRPREGMRVRGYQVNRPSTGRRRPCRRCSPGC